MKIHFLFACLFFSLAVYPQKPVIKIEIPAGNTPWSNLDFNNIPENFQFAIVTDRTGGHRPGVFPKGIRKLNLLKPEFVMSVGDLIEGYTTDTVTLNREWTEFNGFISELEAPFFYVPGNHDITNSVMEEKWLEKFGKTYYHFVYQDVLFLCLNSEDNYRGAGKGTIDDEQFEYFKKVLEENSEVRWTLLFLHQPLWVQNDTKRWNDLENLLKDRPHNVFAGHYHRYWKTERNNGKYIALATTGGGSRLRGTSYGEFDHVVWVTMTEKGPLLANLLLEGIWDENVMTGDLREFVESATYNYPVKPDLYFAESRDEASKELSIRLVNDSDYKMNVELKVAGCSGLKVDFTSKSVEINPNSVEDIKYTVEKTDGMTPELILETKVVYDFEDRADIEISRKFIIQEQQKQFVGFSPSKIKVNGKTKEWSKIQKVAVTDGKNLTGKPFDYQGNNDCSFSYSLAYDHENLYVLAEVIDDQIVVSNEERDYRQDAVEISIDKRKLLESASNTGTGRNDSWFSFTWSPGDDNEPYDLEKLPVKPEYSYSMTENGYVMEVAIPLSYIKTDGDDWNNFRFNIKVIDKDEEGGSLNSISWQPDWSSQNNFYGSGMMYKKK